jgi:hypothetical protein
MTTPVKKRLLLLASLSIPFVLSGCASIARGVTEAVIARSEREDTRVCQVWGRPVIGIEDSLRQKQAKTKVLFVHGVGTHLAGYTTEFLEKLARELDLDMRAADQKNISLGSPLLPNKSLGNLRVTHLLNREKTKELTFYELTWSEITRSQKDLLAFDTSGEQHFRRATINGVLKKFTNDTAPDPIIYVGKSRIPIQASFAQAFCWMASGSWEDLPSSGKHSCRNLTEAHASKVANDNYFIISHSLGSRITTDGLQRITTMLSGSAIQNNDLIVSGKLLETIRNKRVPIFMLSNQLPMLQLGHEPPEVAGDEARESYCKSTGANYKNRMLNETDIIAVSDPNDLLSFSIPREFAREYIDARLCAKITNVNINVAHVLDAFGVRGLANPLDAHVNYNTDDRVIALIARGVGHDRAAPLVKERCDFIEEI